MVYPNRRINRESTQFRGINNILGGPRARAQPPSARAPASEVSAAPRSTPQPGLGVRAGTARVDKEKRLRRGRDNGDLQPTNSRTNLVANPATHGIAREDAKPQLAPVNTAKRKRGDDGDQSDQPLMKRSANGESRIKEAAVATPSPPLKTQREINNDKLQKRLEESRRKRLEEANNKDRVDEASVSALAASQPFRSSNPELQKKIDQIREKNKQKRANLKSRTIVATPIAQQQQALPSPPSSNGTPPSTKTQRDFTEEFRQAKIRRTSAAGLPTSQSDSSLEIARLHSSEMTPSKPPTLPKIKTTPITVVEKSKIALTFVNKDVEEPEHTFAVVDYNDSVPVLFSAQIHHSDDASLPSPQNDQLMVEALHAIEDGKLAQEIGRSSAGIPLGRDCKPDTSLPTRVIDDIDLYMRHEDGKVYVASEQGLLLAASYLTLIGVPPTQPVKFNGRIPPWAKAALAERQSRRVVEDFEAKEPDDLTVSVGSTIEVHRVRDDGMAFCRRQDGVMGWFPFKSTWTMDWQSVDMEKGERRSQQPEETYPDWDGVYFDLLHPEAASKDEFEDFEETLPEKPVSRFREGSAVKASEVKAAPEVKALAAAAASQSTATNTTNQKTTDEKKAEMEAKMAELKAKIKAQREALKAAQESTPSPNTALVTSKTARSDTPQANEAPNTITTELKDTESSEKHGSKSTEVDHAPTTTELSSAATAAKAPSVVEADHAATTAETSVSTPSHSTAAEEIPAPAPEPTPAFSKPRLNPWDCGLEDFVDWSDDEL